ncbi:hypothetical protein F2Q70_00041537 [Brassica cretica]|uniref:Protein kinase domain-containing protein n=1 Tax=Brassica cretica TaxID=69181 RepID=A0A8S9K7T8_BRACR|nr:hypothetical protein F2Q70_00041537 [Brassica cretica]
MFAEKHFHPLSADSPGTHINPGLYGDQRVWTFGFWKGKDGKGCYNTACSGFVQVSKVIPIVEPYDLKTGVPGWMRYSIHQDKNTGNWWITQLMKDAPNEDIGYWPKEIFNLLDNGANMVGVGGVVQASRSGLSPPMGNGNLPNGGRQDSGIFTNIEVLNSNYKQRKMNSFRTENLLDSDKCYGLRIGTIGQGTYSSVFRARETETGKIVALKKVRFDNFEPESVRFMAREILILRRLDHPNIIKLQGLVTSKLSCNIHLVFEYMEHDLTGLLSSPDINFTTPQIKCYMKQLLSGLDHCHARGVMHRDIKGSNLLVNNEGVLKVADFGLANFCNASGNKQPLTSRVVTLWYRPPELLLGATEYGASVDLWSVGCVFAELLLKKPVLQGRTEVEQLHKIFKLCGSPPEDYWRKTKLPHAILFKPQQHYDGCLRETFKDLSDADVSLIETLLSIEPNKRGIASTALVSQYFTTKPYACDPSTLPVYSPSKEIDAKHREETTRSEFHTLLSFIMLYL